MARVTLLWIAGCAVAVTLFTLFVAVPSLVNLQNDGAMMLAFLLPAAVLTADYLLWKQLSPLWDETGSE